MINELLDRLIIKMINATPEITNDELIKVFYLLAADDYDYSQLLKKTVLFEEEKGEFEKLLQEILNYKKLHSDAKGAISNYVSYFDENLSRVLRQISPWEQQNKQEITYMPPIDITKKENLPPETNRALIFLFINKNQHIVRAFQTPSTVNYYIERGWLPPRKSLPIIFSIQLINLLLRVKMVEA